MRTMVATASDSVWTTATELVRYATSNQQLAVTTLLGTKMVARPDDIALWVARAWCMAAGMLVPPSFIDPFDQELVVAEDEARLFLLEYNSRLVDRLVDIELPGISARNTPALLQWLELFVEAHAGSTRTTAGYAGQRVWGRLSRDGFHPMHDRLAVLPTERDQQARRIVQMAMVYLDSYGDPHDCLMAIRDWL